jgi:hypothetical protein
MTVTWKKVGFDEDIVAASEAASTASSAASIADSKADSAAVLGAALVSHAASHMNGGSDELTLDDLGEPTAAVNFFHQQAQNLVIHTVATTAVLSSLNTSAALGKVAYVTAESGIYVCTVSA